MDLSVMTNLTLKQWVAVLGIVGTILTFIGAAGGFVGGVYAFDDRIDAKIDKAITSAMGPMKENVSSMAGDLKAIRQTMDALLLNNFNPGRD